MKYMYLHPFQLPNHISLSSGITAKDSIADATTPSVDAHIVDVCIRVLAIAIVQKLGVGYLGRGERRFSNQCCCCGCSATTSTAADAIGERWQCILGEETKEQHVDEDGRQSRRVMGCILPIMDLRMTYIRSMTCRIMERTTSRFRDGPPSPDKSFDGGDKCSAMGKTGEHWHQQDFCCCWSETRVSFVLLAGIGGEQNDRLLSDRILLQGC